MHAMWEISSLENLHQVGALDLKKLEEALDDGKFTYSVMAPFSSASDAFRIFRMPLGCL